MTITHKLTLDLQHKGKMPRIDVVQGDAFTRQVDLVLENDGKPWLFPICDPVARYCKPDGTMGVYDTLPTGEPAFSYAGNMLTLVLAPQMLTCPGVVQVQVEMNDQELKLATFTFLVVVEPGVALYGESEDYVNWTKAFLPQTTGAKVGQYLQISKVDDVGRITEMAPAENPAGEATNKAYEALRIANDVAQEMKAYSPSGTRSIAEAAMRMASERLVAPKCASVGQYFQVAAVDANGIVTAVEAVDAPSGGNGGLTTAQLDALNGMFKVCVFDDTKDVDGAISAFETAFGIAGSGEVPDEPDVPAGGVEAELITDGLLGYWDLRNPAEVVTKDWHWAYPANLGSGDLYGAVKGGSKGTQSLPTIDNYFGHRGFTIVNGSDTGPSNDNRAKFGTEFTFVILAHGAMPCDGTNGINGIVGSNINPRWNFMGQHYNTANTVVKPGHVGSGNGDSAEDYNFVVKRVNGSRMKVIADTSVHEFSGADYPDFAYWDQTVYTNTLNGDGTVVACAVYNRALSDVEIEEMRAFMKSLEVTA